MPPILMNGEISDEKHGPFTLRQLQQLYHQQLLQQMQEADSARNDLARMRNQLKVETDARSQAQVIRYNCLMKTSLFGNIPVLKLQYRKI